MIYRAQVEEPSGPGLSKSTIRPPSNVPYLVDNLWEWMRPDGHPTRRRAIFAAPSPEGARRSGAPGATAYRVDLPADWPVAQLQWNSPERWDAKNHSDIRILRNIVLADLGLEWLKKPVPERGREAELFLPCLTKEEVEDVLSVSLILNGDRIRDASTYWQDVKLVTVAAGRLDPLGEVSFLCPPDGFHLRPIA